MSLLSLEIDIGNSTLKWRVVSGQDRLEGGRIASSPAQLAALLGQGLMTDLAEVRVASVGSVERDQPMLDLLAASGLSVKLAASQAFCAGVRNSYGDPSRMGVDRWLAMVAAYVECEGACVVIDAGTALTIDVIDGGGAHLGGYIIPGVAMSARALAEYTGRVRFDGADKQSLAPGKDTESCVHHGKWLAQFGAVQAALAWSEGVLGRSEVFITGGDAQVLMALAGSQAATWRYSEELVLDGLAPVLASS
ncbi:type III pantothenate kinase [Zhongshania sp.]|uniref:type III pantothenate kinase n=1 Tax=Zhongshania sp. TaxID=1971902 RepID=UPI00356AA3BE